MDVQASFEISATVALARVVGGVAIFGLGAAARSIVWRYMIDRDGLLVPLQLSGVAIVAGVVLFLCGLHDVVLIQAAQH